MAMRIFIYIALVAFFANCFVGCAEVTYDDEISATESNKNAPDLPQMESAPQIATKQTKPKISLTKPANYHKDSKKILKSPRSQDLSNLANAKIPKDLLNKSTSHLKPLFYASNLPLPTLKAQCDSRDLQKCEDLGRIYAVQGKRDLATAHYKKACDNGKGLVMSCFFNSLIFANNGDSATANEYLGAISSDTLSAIKIDEAELLLAIGEIALIKDKLKIVCISGEIASCHALLSVFKIRGELSEARVLFSAECTRTNEQNHALCAILKAM